MRHADTQFAGSIPDVYERYLGPMLFAPYAADLARRVRALAGRRVLEVGAGTGLVTRALLEALPDAEIQATDLNGAMLALAASRVSSARRPRRQRRGGGGVPRGSAALHGPRAARALRLRHPRARAPRRRVR